MPYKNPVHVMSFDTWFGEMELDELASLPLDKAYWEAAKHAAILYLWGTDFNCFHSYSMVFHNTGPEYLTLGVVDLLQQVRPNIGITLTFPEKMNAQLPGVQRPPRGFIAPIRKVGEFTNCYPITWMVSDERLAIFTETEVLVMSPQDAYDRAFYFGRDLWEINWASAKVMVNTGPAYISLGLVDGIQSSDSRRHEICLIYPDKVDEIVEGIQRRFTPALTAVGA